MAVFLTLLVFPLPNATAQEATVRAEGEGVPSPGRTPRRVYAGIYLHDVTDLELRDGLFEADFELWAKWRGDFDPSALEVANAADVERQSLGAEQDGDWHTARYRVRGTLRNEFPVQRFPFDSQRVAVVLELPDRFGVLTPDLASSGMAERFSLSDWYYEPEFSPAVGTRLVTSDLGVLETEGEPTTVHRVAYQVVLERPVTTVGLKLFLPLAIIGLVALVALFLHPELIDARSSIGITALLSCFAFQFTVGDSLPAVTYITFADVLFLIAYATSSVALVESVAVHALARRGRIRAAVWIDRLMRGVLPAGAALTVALTMPGPVPKEPPRVASVPAENRTPSGRDTLRIGSTVLSSLWASPVDEASDWSLMPNLGGEEPAPLFVEVAPGVDSDALRFLASGELEVAWRLREGLVWSDGAPVVAGDLRLPYETIDNPRVVAIETPDDRTLRLRWDAVYAEALEPPTPWPSHVLGELAASGGYEAVRDRLRNEGAPVLGPYRHVSFEKDVLHVAEANPHYAGVPPAIRRVEVRSFDDRDALVEAFLAGEVDVTTPNSVTMEQAQAVAAERPDAAHIAPAAVLITLSPDLTHPQLGRLEVRRALLAAIDRPRIARALYGEAGRVAHRPIPPVPPIPPIPPIPPPRGAEVLPPHAVAHDPERAERVLEDSGLRELTIHHDPSPTTAQFIGLVVEDLEKVGVEVTTEEHRSVLPVSRTEHGGLVVYLMAGRRASSTQRFWNLPVVDGAYPEDYRSDAYTEAVHALVERERHAVYPERRRQLQDALFDAFAERLPHLPMVFAAERILADPALEGWQRHPEDYFGVGLERWHFAGGP